MNKYSETIVVQRDYVSRTQMKPLRHRKISSRKKQGNLSSILEAIITITSIVLVIFIGILYCVVHQTKQEPEVIKVNRSNKTTRNSLPPQPKERWRYIRELESCKNDTHQADEPYIIAQQLKKKNKSSCNTQLIEKRQHQVQVQQQQPVHQEIKEQSQKKAAQPYQEDLLQKSFIDTKTQKADQIKREIDDMMHQAGEKKDEYHWIIQCGSFKATEQAETVRAQLVFEGFDSRIITKNGWNRVMIGSVNSKNSAERTISRLKIAGHKNCIQLASGD